MTMSTHFVIKEPVGAVELFHFCQSLIGDPKTQQIDVDQDFRTWRNEGTATLSNLCGQGLPVWLIMHHAVDAPISSDCWDTGHADAHAPPWDTYCIEIDWDSCYTDGDPFRSNLHAYLVSRLAGWCTERSLSWAWRHDHTGHWFTNLDELTILGDPTTGDPLTHV